MLNIIIIIIFIIYIISIKNKNNYIETFKNYKYLTFQKQNLSTVGFTLETFDLKHLLQNKFMLNPRLYTNSTQILNNINNNKLDFGIVYHNFFNNKYNNIKKISYISYSSHLILTYNNTFNNIFDLSNKKICLGINNSDTYQIGKYIFNLLKINIIPITFNNYNDIIYNFNSFDALYLNIINPNSYIFKLNIDKLNFIDITNNIDKNILYRINLLKNKNNKYLPYNNNSINNNPSNNIWLVCNKNYNSNFINKLFNIIIKLNNYKIKINNNFFIKFNNIANIVIDDNEVQNRNKIINDPYFKSFQYNPQIDYHNIIIDNYIKLGYITYNKNFNSFLSYNKFN
tara:strand:+ start:1355 stop:2380 length:1026 start_codon:yes stop_codon:yes gene_type:complete